MSAESSAIRLAELCSKNLSGRRLILASNRGPVEYRYTEDGELQPFRGSGGVVTALSSVSKYIELDWIASAMGKADREAAKRADGERLKISLNDETLYVRFVVNPGNTYHKFYSIICNPLLWFLQHYMWNSPRTPNIDHTAHDAWRNGYLPVNQAFAQAVIQEVRHQGPPAIVMLHDYHLYLASAYIRQEMPDLIIHHFTHIPWPAACYWLLLPSYMRQAIHRSLCTANIIGLQTQRDAQNFLNCCQSFIEGAEIDYARQSIRLGSHTVQVKVYPISIDVAGLKQMACSDRCQEYKERLSRLYGEQTIVRVDRCEPSKNLIRGFRAFDMFLERYPQFVGKVKFIAFIVPSRGHLKPYQRYTDDVFNLIEVINNKYRTENWHPIDYFYENNYAQAMAGMCLYDVLLVNAVIDGMNLVAKEGPTVNERDGVLVLSESVGAYDQLKEYTLPVSPADLDGTAEALYTALTMSPDEKRRCAVGLKESIERESITDWLLHLLEDIVSLIETRSGTATPKNALPHLHRPR